MEPPQVTEAGAVFATAKHAARKATHAARAAYNVLRDAYADDTLRDDAIATYVHAVAARDAAIGAYAVARDFYYATYVAVGAGKES